MLLNLFESKQWRTANQWLKLLEMDFVSHQKFENRFSRITCDARLEARGGCLWLCRRENARKRCG
jgi:hypothetical protein